MYHIAHEEGRNETLPFAARQRAGLHQRTQVFCLCCLAWNLALVFYIISEGEPSEGETLGLRIWRLPVYGLEVYGRMLCMQIADSPAVAGPCHLINQKWMQGS